ncbi:MAG: hypothetical protein JWO20_3126 [Candidatus Angelobacter sp.]|nr:hypothetical protein [Candidatus Angelobacter sp.]
MHDEQFAPAVRDLIDKWNNGVGVFWPAYEERCRIIYEVWKETSKPGRSGQFTSALRQLKFLPRPTAYHMLRHHRIQMGELDDWDAEDPRDDAEPDDDHTSGGKKNSGKKPRKRKVSQVTIVLQGELATAVRVLQKSYKCKDVRKVIIEVCLRAYRQLSTPVINQADKLPQRRTRREAA